MSAQKICMILAATTIAFLANLDVALAYSNTDWVITKPKWTPTDEKGYQNFVVTIATAVEKGKCATVKDCLQSDINPYRFTDPAEMRLFSDCADLPYFIRGYYAWKNGLPFSMSTRMVLKNKDEKRKGASSWKFWEWGKPVDVRYSVGGNVVAERFNVITRNSPTNALPIFQDGIALGTSSASFRTDVDHPNDGDIFTDFVSLKISRETVIPGNIIYDPNGHVTLIYKVTDDGRIYYMDAHPDNSLTTGTFSSKFMRTNAGQGGGFKGWRPYELVDYNQASDGTLIGGRIVAYSNEQIPYFGIEQYTGTIDPLNLDYMAAQFVRNGRAMDFYEYVRMTLSRGDLKLNPVTELEASLNDLCDSMKNRIHAVDIAIKAMINLKEHPKKLPENIYGTLGEWETYSTPSRDAQIKTVFIDMVENTKRLISRHRQNDPSIEYKGNNLILDLWNTYYSVAQRCQLGYTNSAGSTVQFNLDEARLRLFKMSFDPYHCIELRWGASSPQELASCLDNPEKQKWYVNEQRLRNQPDRRYDLRMDFTVDELASPREGNGIETAPNVDLPNLLRSLAR